MAPATSGTSAAVAIAAKAESSTKIDNPAKLKDWLDGLKPS
jgi:hypothetical protein